MPKIRVLLASLFFVSFVSSSILQLYPCDFTNSQQQWQFRPVDGPTNDIQVVTVGSNPSLCVSLVNCSTPIQNQAEVTLEPCNNNRCDSTNSNQRWEWDAKNGFLYSSLSSSSLDMCLTLAATTGPTVNMWPCKNGGNSSRWSLLPINTTAPTIGYLRTLEPLDSNQCLQRTPGPSDTIMINGSIIGRTFDGIGGLAAIGGARLLYEYPEPYRTDILDLLFTPFTGAHYHVLKTEIEGDVDSSYGSGPAYRHTADPASVSFNRGIYLPWLIQEAKKRNPDLVLYSLSWGVPGYIESYFSELNLDYHIGYLQGALSVWNTTFDYTGVWNERPFNRSWVKQLRQSLDDAGLHHTKIVVNDQSDGGCADCPAAWGNSLHAALENDPDFRNAVGVVGFHSADVEGLSPFDAPWESYGLKYWQSESNIADGPMPQWEPNEGNGYGTGLSWPRVFIANYIRARATTTILCPITHSFTWMYGRENHGHCEMVEPWSGYYELGSGFWGQAQFTQFTAPGWTFLDGQGSNQFCSSSGDDSCYLLWATLVSPDQKDVSIILVNTQDTSLPNLNLTFQFVNGNFPSFYGQTLQVWQTVEDNYFFNVPEGVTLNNQGYLNISLPSRSVTTITSLTTGAHTIRPIPNRMQFPIPFRSTFDQQKLEEPGRLLSDLWGTFYVMKDPSSVDNQVLYQAVSINPEPTSWMGTGVPFTSLPAGTNWVNTNTSIQFSLSSKEVNLSQPLNYVYFCGRVPIWQPANFEKTYAVGICLTINYNLGNQSWSWLLNGNTFTESVLYGQNLLTATTILDTWHTLGLLFNDDQVTAYFDGTELTTVGNIVFSSGVVGLGTSWTTAYFDNLFLDSNSQHPNYNSSYLYDILPGETLLNNVTGWMGMAIDLTDRPVCVPSPGTVQQALQVTNLGRFKTMNNTGKHLMDIRKASTGESMLPNQQPVTVNMMNCVSDLLGFCYTPTFPVPVTLPVGDTYYIVTYETAGTDSFRELVNAAKMTIHASGRRDGTSYMSYRGPQYGCVSGRVYQYEGQETFILVPEFDTSYGPVNMLVVQET